MSATYVPSKISNQISTLIMHSTLSNLKEQEFDIIWELKLPHTETSTTWNHYQWEANATT